MKTMTPIATTDAARIRLRTTGNHDALLHEALRNAEAEGNAELAARVRDALDGGAQVWEEWPRQRDECH